MQGVTVVDHPLVQHKLTIMRKKETSTAGFRRLLREISLLLGYEVTRNLELTTTTIETPIEEMEALMLDLPACYEGLPLAAHGTRSKRYKK